MKKILAVMLSLSTLIIFAGCGETSSSSSSSTSSAVPATKMFDTVKGQVEIPTNPQKIVTDFYLGEFLAVGVKPIISSQYPLSNPFLSEYIDGIVSLDTASAETSKEQIVAAEPDLIVTIKEEDYETFSKIAPTVLLPYGTYNDKETFLYIADMVGKKADAEAKIKTFEDKALSYKDDVQAIVGDQTVSIIEAWASEIYVMGNKFARGGYILYDMWELKAPEPIQTKMIDGTEMYEVISMELLPQYAGDFIIYGVLAGVDSSYIEDTNIWKTLPAVKDQKVMTYEQVAFMHSDPITLSKQLDIYIEFFNKYA